MDRKSLLTDWIILLLVVSTVAFGFGSVESSPEKINETVGSERGLSIDRPNEVEDSKEDEIELDLGELKESDGKKNRLYRDENFLEEDDFLFKEKRKHYLEEENYTKRNPIYINGNDDFHVKAEENNWFGNGTEQNPYIIEGYKIAGGDTDVDEPNYAIIIRNTNVHFEIRNNFLFGAFQPVASYSTSAAALTNVTNGVVRNNTIRSNSHGINLLESNYNEVLNNTLIDNDRAILITSNNNTIAGNNVTIEDGSPMRNLAGIYLSGSAEYNTLTENRISNYDDATVEARGILGDDDSENNLIYHNILMNNEVHALDHGDNIWNKPYPIGGNFWDNHTGPDEYSGPDQDEPDSDGFVDEPKEIEGRGNSVDKYPLTTTTPPEVEEEDEDDIPGFNLTLLLLAAVISVAIYEKKR